MTGAKTREIWPQRTSTSLPPHQGGPIFRGRISAWLTLVLTCLMASGGGGVWKPKVPSDLNHRELQHVFTPFSQAAKKQEKTLYWGSRMTSKRWVRPSAPYRHVILSHDNVMSDTPPHSWSPQGPPQRRRRQVQDSIRPSRLRRARPKYLTHLIKSLLLSLWILFTVICNLVSRLICWFILFFFWTSLSFNFWTNYKNAYQRRGCAASRDQGMIPVSQMRFVHLLKSKQNFRPPTVKCEDMKCEAIRWTEVTFLVNRYLSWFRYCRQIRLTTSNDWTKFVEVNQVRLHRICECRWTFET